VIDLTPPISAKRAIGLIILVITLAVIFSLILTGCAGSAADRDFRSKVERVSIHAAPTYDIQSQQIGGSLDTDFYFRDPSSK
jgi:hypothetical protein